jgi:hypothetical protein
MQLEFISDSKEENSYASDSTIKRITNQTKASRNAIRKTKQNNKKQMG